MVFMLVLFWKQVDDNLIDTKEKYMDLLDSLK